jgi:hypothetical protein
MSSGVWRPRDPEIIKCLGKIFKMLSGVFEIFCLFYLLHFVISFLFLLLYSSLHVSFCTL